MYDSWSEGERGSQEEGWIEHEEERCWERASKDRKRIYDTSDMLRIHKMTGCKAFKWQIACKLWTKTAPPPPRRSKHRSGVCLGVS